MKYCSPFGEIFDDKTMVSRRETIVILNAEDLLTSETLVSVMKKVFSA